MVKLLFHFLFFLLSFFISFYSSLFLSLLISLSLSLFLFLDLFIILKVKFFERKKLTRKICQIDKELEEVKRNNLVENEENIQKLENERIEYENLLTV